MSIQYIGSKIINEAQQDTSFTFLIIAAANILKRKKYIQLVKERFIDN